MKLYLEIAVDQQTRAGDRTFEGVPNSGCPGTATPIFGQFLSNHLNMFKTMCLDALLVATSLLNTCIKFIKIG